MRPTLYWVDGQQSANLPIDDRGLLLADGVFETLWFEDGQFFYADYHQRRLAAGLAVLDFPGPERQAQESLEAALSHLSTHEPSARGVVRLTITRGSGPRGYRPPSAPVPRVIGAYFAAQPSPFRPLNVGWAELRWSRQPKFAGCKLLARTEQVMAAAEADNRGLDDVLMRDQEGWVISSSSANLIVRFGSDLLTPLVDEAGIAGTRLAVVRSELIQHFGLKLRDVALTLEDLLDADELLLCNTVRGMQSVASLGDQRWEASPLARELFAAIASGRRVTSEPVEP